MSDTLYRTHRRHFLAGEKATPWEELSVTDGLLSLLKRIHNGSHPLANHGKVKLIFL